jgi:hypothetical protein
MSSKYVCIVKLKNDSSDWNIDGSVESCIEQLSDLGVDWEFVGLQNVKTQEIMCIIFPYDESFIDQ